MRLKASEIAPWRAKVLADQGGRCALCNRKCVKPVGDHDHKSGAMRAVLCSGCNSMLGVIENNRPRYGLSDLSKLATFLKAVAPYIHSHSVAPRPEIHPTFKTEDEKRLARNKKARAARARRKVEAD